MLGTNDFQSMHQRNGWHSAPGTAALVAAIRSPPIEPGMPTPTVLIVAPPPTRTPRGALASTSNAGGVHLDADQHLTLATALAAEVVGLLDRTHDAAPRER